VRDLLDLQRDFNKTVSQMIEHRNLMLKGKWLVPRGCEVEQEAITTEPGEIIEYVADPLTNGKPEIIRPLPIDGSYFQLLQEDVQTFYRIAGIGEASRGEPVPNIRTGKGLEVLKAGNTERLQTIVRADFENWREIGAYSLWLAGQHWPDGKEVAVTGRNLAHMIKSFNKAAFAEPMDVFVENDDALPTDPVDRLQVLGAIYGPGGIMASKDISPEDKKLYFQMARFTDISRLIAQQNLDEVNTRRKRDLIIETQGQANPPILADSWEDHATCRRVLADYFKTADYYALPPGAQQGLQNLDASHAAYLAPPAPGEPVPPPPVGPGGNPLGPGQFTPQALAESAQNVAQSAPEGSPPAPPSLPQ
jgi:hypothetical protein